MHIGGEAVQHHHRGRTRCIAAINHGQRVVGWCTHNEAGWARLGQCQYRYGIYRRAGGCTPTRCAGVNTRSGIGWWVIATGINCSAVGQHRSSTRLQRRYVDGEGGACARSHRAGYVAKQVHARGHGTTGRTHRSAGTIELQIRGQLVAHVKTSRTGCGAGVAYRQRVVSRGSYAEAARARFAQTKDGESTHWGVYRCATGRSIGARAGAGVIRCATTDIHGRAVRYHRVRCSCQRSHVHGETGAATGSNTICNRTGQQLAAGYNTAHGTNGTAGTVELHIGGQTVQHLDTGRAGGPTAVTGGQGVVCGSSQRETGRAGFGQRQHGNGIHRCCDGGTTCRRAGTGTRTGIRWRKVTACVDGCAVGQHRTSGRRQSSYVDRERHASVDSYRPVHQTLQV